jgi:YbbR domain-containing protein
MSQRPENGRLSWPQAAASVARGSALTLYQHWALALFSLGVAFVIWFVIQDVENPRVRGAFPADLSPTLDVQVVNSGRLIPIESYLVAVEVEGREGDLATLAEDDFEATIDVNGIPPNVPTEVPVRVQSTRDGVRVLRVEPASVSVTLEPIVEREFEVRLNPSGQLAAGLSIADVEIQPLTVRVSGLGARVETVASVDLDVNLSALREGSVSLEGDLRARAAGGAEVALSITPARAEVTYTIDQIFVQRVLPVIPILSGQPAPGYRVSNIVVEPAAMSVSGPANEVGSITQLSTEPIPLTNANSEIRRVSTIDVSGLNLSPERSQVSVRIEVTPIQCGATNPACPALTIQVAPGVLNPPAGQFVQGSLSVLVRLAGPLPVLQTLNPRVITASVNLAAAGPGGLYPVTVTIPTDLANAGVRAEPVDPISVTLGPNP